MKESTSTIRRDAFGPRFVAGRSSRPRRSRRDNAFADAPRDMPVAAWGVISTFRPSGSTARVASCTRARSLSFGSILHEYDLLHSGSEVWTPGEVMTPKPADPDDRRTITSCGHATAGRP